MPLLQNRAESVHGDEEVTVLFHRGNALVRQGSWKLTAIEAVFDESKFALYNLSIDPGETTDLSDAEPEKYAELIEIWRQQRLELGIILPQDLQVPSVEVLQRTAHLLPLTASMRPILPNCHEECND